MKGQMGEPFLVPVESCTCRSVEGGCGRWRGAARVAGSRREGREEGGKGGRGKAESEGEGEIR